MLRMLGLYDKSVSKIAQFYNRTFSAELLAFVFIARIIKIKLSRRKDINCNALLNEFFIVSVSINSDVGILG